MKPPAIHSHREPQQQQQQGATMEGEPRQQTKCELSKSQQEKPPNKTLNSPKHIDPDAEDLSSPMRRALHKLNRKRWLLGSKLNESWSKHSYSWDAEKELIERQVRVKTLDLFRYALFREKLAFGLGVLFMWYAASWQPISVFILAIMASLMGHYSKQTSLMLQLNKSMGEEESGQGELGQLLSLPSPSSNAATLSTDNELNTTAGFGPELVFASAAFRVEAATSGSSPPIRPGAYDSYGFLAPLYSVVTPLFDCLMGSSRATSTANSLASNDDIKADVHDILDHESKHFLRKSFEINGSAFALALTQLTAFFIGMTLITWAAKKQASRIKILYFRSCLHQEVTWFEAIDSASGSGSSLNNLVDKFEDGIGTKLALLCYFLGHVALFALTALSQMFNLAAFCMPFVLLVGIIIIYLSDWQAIAIGEHAMFAKRSLQLAEEIIAAIRTVFAFNGQQKEITRFGQSLEPVYRKSLIKHLYTALNTSLSKFSIFACFSAYCFYAMRLFPPYAMEPLDKATVLAVMRGAEVSIVNILISIPFMEALQQSKGSIARIFAAIERRSKIDPSSQRGAKPAKWEPSISFRMVQFGYADRSGPTRRRSTLPFLNLPGSPGSQTPDLSPDPHAATTTTTNVIGHNERSSSSSSTIERQSIGNSINSIAHEDHHGANGGQGRRRKSSGSSSGMGADWRPAPATKRMLTTAGAGPNYRVLSQFNLDIRAGKSVALVGPSGSGKSTVLALVQRLYDINNGQLLVGQHNIKDLSVAWLRNQIGVVTQEPRLFDMTIEENIRLGLPDDDEDNDNTSKQSGDTSGEQALGREARIRQQVLEAAQAACVHEFVSRLPRGYETRVGSGGVQLSGGQKQRIAIARALIRKPKILLLDESTSALDTESEAHVQTALRQASVGRTTLTVAHRLATIKHADVIVVMNQGRVVECGSHDELMADTGCPSGIYRQMYQEQLSAVEGKARDKISEQAAADYATGGSVTSDGPQKKGLLSQLVEFVTPLDANKEKAVAASATNGDHDFESSEDKGCAPVIESISGSLSSPTSDDNKTNLKPTTGILWKFLELPKWSSIGSVLVCLVAGLILPMNLIAHSYLFTAFAYQEPEQIGDYLRVFGLLILSFSSLVFIVSFLQVILPGYVGERISTRLRCKTLDSILSKPVFYFDIDTNSAGSLCDRFNSCISDIQSLAGTRVATMLEAISTLAVGAFYGFGQNLRLSLFCLGFALLVLITTIIESRIVQKESKLQQKFDAQLAHLMVDALSNIKTIASLNKEKFFIDKFSKLIGQREVGIGRHIVCLRIFLMSLKFVMPAMSWSASMYYGCHLLVDGRIDLQTVFIVCPVVLFAVNDTFRALVFLPELLKARNSIERLYLLNREFSPQLLQNQTLGQRVHTNQTGLATSGVEPTKGVDKKRPSLLESIAKFVVEPPQGLASQLSHPQATPNRRLSSANYMNSTLGDTCKLNSLIPTAKARGHIQFKGVHFAYPQRPEARVLQGLSLSVAPGETLALVGGSGSGKSTCAAILEKFYDFQAGRVTIDGHDLRLLNDQWVRSQIGLVMQEPTLLSYTIGDNIRYGDNGRFVPMDEVVRAAREANIHEFISSLPDQYDTQLSGSSHSGGCQLSGGQRQRIAIARALISNAPILVFDEATSALDSRNESLVQDALDKARRGRTSVIIAHRLASIREADKIAVLRDGRLVESGRHEDLLELESGHYRSLWLRQEGVSQQAGARVHGAATASEEDVNLEVGET